MNEFFPCILVEHSTSFSIICTNFHYFDEIDGGGYSVERLARKLAKEHQLTRDITFDSEAGMFSASASNKAVLLQLTSLLREITGGEEQHKACDSLTLSIDLKEAEELLLAGFVLSLDEDKQAQFNRQVPYPAVTPVQHQHIQAIQGGTAEEKIIAAKKINAEARTKTRDWKHYLSHPQTIDYFLTALDQETNPKVEQELIWALVFICDRHLPDLRTQAYFMRALASKNATMRWLGIMGLANTSCFSLAVISSYLDDKSKKVRDEAQFTLLHHPDGKRTFPSWMFSEERVKRIEAMM
ncbi:MULTISPECIES: Imm51 family immunity protein [unclassified Myroides]|uniref:Imm51 family immunity protein n=1 Tax=unclassified Myroides TaxID=2642485 RepID=UPI003D2F7C4C